MTVNMQNQLKVLHELIDQINRRLDMILGLTEAMSEALEKDDIESFEELIAKRQDLMDNIDDLNREVRKIRLAMDINLENSNQSAPLDTLLTKRQQLLADIQQKDSVNREAALLRNEQYKAVLREVKKQRDVQQYDRDSLTQESHFIDTKG